MSKFIRISIVLLWTAVTLPAQQTLSCSQLLEDASEAFSAGMVELVPGLIASCVEENGYEEEERLEAYRLLITSYLFDYMNEAADSVMADFVTTYPSYEQQEEDAEEFISLYKAHLDLLKAKEEAERQHIADSLLANLALQERGACKNMVSLGLNLGVSATLPYELEAYSLGDLFASEGRFHPLPGAKAEVLVNLAAGRRMEFTTGVHVHFSSFSYSASPLSYSDYLYKENQLILGLPLSMILKLNPGSERICWYLRLGGRGEYLLSVTGGGERTIVGNGPALVIDPQDITAIRKSFGFSLQSGAGLRIPLGQAYFQAEAGFDSGLFQANISEERYSNQALVWELHHIDSDFIRQEFHFDLGIFWYLK